MDGRGNATGGKEKTSVRITRRSCDQCRARKVGCDRNTPCAPCLSARLSCTHSAVAQSSTSKQRVLISAQYERKIDGIARDIDGIKRLLQTVQLNGDGTRSMIPPIPPIPPTNPMPLLETSSELSATGDAIAWKNSTHVISLIRTVCDMQSADPESTQTISSLQKLLDRLERPPSQVAETSQELKSIPSASTGMPPQDTVVAVLRWVKEHAFNVRISWLGQLLPLENFNQICQNTYFSVDGCSQIDYILANGYLSYIFFEHQLISGRLDYAEYSRICRNNLNSALTKLPHLIPSSMEAIAALTLGAYAAVEDSRANAAWIFISAAANHCLMLGFNHPRIHSSKRHVSMTTHEQLFWAVYRLEKGISLRLGRASCFRSGDIPLPPIPDDARIRLADIQGRAYDELYSPRGLARGDTERACAAESLAVELRQCIIDTQADIFKAFGNDDANPTDPAGKAYMQCELICQYSLFALVLRAVPHSVGSLYSASEECLSIAREALRVHEECIRMIQDCRNEPLMLARYANWAIVHCPFPPFSILLTHAIYMMDTSELCSLERFAASLEPLDSSSVFGPSTQRCHVYTLLCKAARLYISFNSIPTDSRALEVHPEAYNGADVLETGVTSNAPQGFENEGGWLGEWFHDHQLVAGMMDNDLVI